MEKIAAMTEYLFGCDFFADDFDADEKYDHYDCAQKLMEEYKWSDIYDAWIDYLVNNCDAPEKVINFVNLFSYYGGQDQAVKDPYYFLGYIYCVVDMEKYWDEAGSVFDGIAISLLENCGKVNVVKNPYYSPEIDPEVMVSVQKWRKRIDGIK